ncbi:hypothetical protein L6R52_07035 [Myxococcota bacterium]|nr:hypothetical protein [Myxococcota bacterium]
MPANDGPLSDLTGSWVQTPDSFLSFEGQEVTPGWPKLELVRQSEGQLEGWLQVSADTASVALAGRIEAAVFALEEPGGPHRVNGVVLSHTEVRGSWRPTVDAEPRNLTLKRAGRVPSDVDLETLFGDYEARIVIGDSSGVYEEGRVGWVRLGPLPDGAPETVSMFIDSDLIRAITDRPIYVSYVRDALGPLYGLRDGTLDLASAPHPWREGAWPAGAWVLSFGHNEGRRGMRTLAAVLSPCEGCGEDGE